MLNEITQALSNLLTTPFTGSLTSSFALIALAELGDKSQLVCMSLASRHRTAPVFLGATSAFILLNSLAVAFGAAIAAWIPDYWRNGMVALLFAGFGLHALLAHDADPSTDAVSKPRSSHSIFLTTFSLITLAELGDKTQLAVVGFSSTMPLAAIWLGATLALSFTTALGIWAGKTVLQKLPLRWLHWFSGVLFLLLATVAGWQCYQALMVDYSWLYDNSHFIAGQLDAQLASQ